MDRLFRLLLGPASASFCRLGTEHSPAKHSSRPSFNLALPSPKSRHQPAQSRVITIDVQVKDKSGAPVLGLQQQDFTVLDDKRPQNILSFHAVDNGAASTTDPVEVVLVVDAVNTSFNAITYARSELKKFLLQNGGKLAQPVSLVVFSDTGTKMQGDPSRDGNALAALYDQYETGLRVINRSAGFYGATERFDLSLKTLTQLVEYKGKQPGRKLMVWFSPGWPLLSGPNILLTSKESERLVQRDRGALHRP